MTTTTLIGNLGRSELRYTAGGNAVLNLSVAVNRRRYSKERGEWEDAGTDWHRVVQWGGKAEATAATVMVGDRVIVTGSLESRTYDKDGEKRTAWDIRADEVGLVAKAEKRASTAAPSSSAADDPWATGGQAAEEPGW